MGKNRLEAFSDGVIAIIIMVLEMKVPQGHDLSALKTIIPVFLCYVLSFLYVGIYWNNHHHVLHVTHHVNGAILWANMHLLFWLSLIPFVTRWMGESKFAAVPTSLYGTVLFMTAIAYWILVRAIIARHGKGSLLAKAVGKDLKGNLSVVMYIIAIPVAFFFPIIANGLYCAVALWWLMPDRRIEVEVAKEAWTKSHE